MGLPAIIDTIEAVPEAQRPLYVQIKDEKSPAKGKYALDVDPAAGFGLEHVEGYKSTIGRLRDIENEHKAKLKAYEGLDPAAAREALANVEKLKGAVPKDQLDALVGAQVGEVKRTMQATLDQMTAAGKSKDEIIRELAIDQSATSAIVAAGGNVDLLLPLIRGIAQIEAVEGQKLPAVRLRQNGVLLSTKKPGSTDPMSVSEYVEVLKEKYPQAFSAPAASGSGAAGGAGRSGSGGGGRIKVTTSDLSNPKRMSELEAEARKAGVGLAEYVTVEAG